MNTRNTTLTRFGICAVALAIVASAAIADYQIGWSTIDGGGATFSTGGNFSLGGTVGQHDAGPSTTGQMTGGQFSLVGGFWAMPSVSCSCLADMNGDGQRNGNDVQDFVACLTSGGACTCADLDGVNSVTLNDVPIFVQTLLDGTGCP